MFDPTKMPGPHFRPSDLASQARLAAIDFQSRAQSPEQLDIANPILSKGLKRGEREAAGTSGGARDGRTLQAAYYAMIKLIDDQIARILSVLDESGQRDDTIIIFTSDHGEALGDHGLIQKGCRFYEGLVRVPLIFSCPARILAGVRSDALVELMDIAPTLLDLAGIAVPKEMQAKSLLPILDGGAPADRHRDFVRSEYYDALDLPAGSLATMYRDRRWKLVVYHQHDFGELFDLSADPWEHDDLWDLPAYADTRGHLCKASFDATVRAFDRGPPRIGPF
jgi:arylsulfatase A-like enzyme